VEKEKDFSFMGHLPPHKPSPQREADPALAPLSPTAASGPWHPHGPTDQPPLSLPRPTCRNPLPYSVRWCLPTISPLSHPIPSLWPLPPLHLNQHHLHARHLVPSNTEPSPHPGCAAASPRCRGQAKRSTPHYLFWCSDRANLHLGHRLAA
jgi:hypothetical protein